MKIFFIYSPTFQRNDTRKTRKIMKIAESEPESAKMAAGIVILKSTRLPAAQLHEEDPASRPDSVGESTESIRIRRFEIINILRR